MPENLHERRLEPNKESEFTQNSHAANLQLLCKGRQFLQEVYGEQQGSQIEKALSTISPRLSYYAIPLVYGGIYADTSALTTRDVSDPMSTGHACRFDNAQATVLMFLCNMAVDTPKQAIGHIASSRRQGVTTHELLNVGILTRSIAELYQIKLRTWDAIMEAVDSEERTESNPYEL